MTTPFETHPPSTQHDLLAPDGSQIQLRHRLTGGSMVYCMLPAGEITQAVRHRSVEELWYIVAGRGQLWRKQGDHAQVVDLLPGMSLTIPLGTDFQFRALGEETLGLVICTLPPWPGEDEAIPVAGLWDDART